LMLEEYPGIMTEEQIKKERLPERKIRYYFRNLIPEELFRFLEKYGVRNYQLLKRDMIWNAG